MTYSKNKFIPCILLNKTGQSILELHTQYHKKDDKTEQSRILSEFKTKIASNYGPCRMAFENPDSIYLEEKLCRLIRFTVTDENAFEQINPAVQEYLQSLSLDFKLTQYRPSGKNKSMTLSIDFIFGISTVGLEKKLLVSHKEAKNFIYDGAYNMLSVIVLNQVKKLLRDPPLEYMPKYDNSHVKIKYNISNAKNNQITLTVSFLVPFFWISYNQNALSYVSDKLKLLKEFADSQKIFDN